jgi:hypothetical protein
VVREIRRHYPQVYERAAGLARGAGVPRRLVLTRLSAEAGGCDRPRSSEGPLLAVAPSRSGASAGIAKTVDLPSELGVGLVLRRSRPDPGFVSLEVTMPSLPAALAGVNEAGLALAVAAHAKPCGSARDTAAPPLLLVQECLQRFETVSRAIEWCESRPAATGATLLIADASGRIAGVEFAGSGARVLDPRDGVLLENGGRKLAPLRRDRELDLETLRRVLASQGAPDSDGRACAGEIWLDPSARRVGLALDSARRGSASELAFFPVS